MYASSCKLYSNTTNLLIFCDSSISFLYASLIGIRVYDMLRQPKISPWSFILASFTCIPSERWTYHLYCTVCIVSSGIYILLILFLLSSSFSGFYSVVNPYSFSMGQLTQFENFIYTSSKYHFSTSNFYNLKILNWSS